MIHFPIADFRLPIFKTFNANELIGN